MESTALLHDLVAASAARRAEYPALTYRAGALNYGEFAQKCGRFASGLMALDLERGGRVAVYLDKCPEAAIACFGTSAAGGAFVPINPILKAAQVAHILRDSGAHILVTSFDRLEALSLAPLGEISLRHIVVVGAKREFCRLERLEQHNWVDVLSAPACPAPRVIDSDIAAILYTSGSTGRPKGVVLSHRNLVVGAKSVSQYLENRADDVLLAALPLSFDAGFSQLTTAFYVGARVVLLNYLMPRDVVEAIQRERVTGLTAVPPLWIQLSRLHWPSEVAEHLRYIANTGGRMPLQTLARLREALPKTRPFLMYGLTEAFRATYLPPEEVDRRPDSIGKAIPNAEVLVLREDGSECSPNEPGELVQRGALVGMGYWNDPEKTAERYRPLPAGVGGRARELAIPELAVFSGDTVSRDEEGYLYFIGRRDEMIKTSGYRVSPGEVEEILYATGMVSECAAFGVEHDSLGQCIIAIVTPPDTGFVKVQDLIAECRIRMPAYMVPSRVVVRDGPLPRNANGKIDRKSLAEQIHE